MFVEKHGLWTDEQRVRAAELKSLVDEGDVNLVRLAWADPHGCSRAKAVTVPVFVEALASGYNINVATTTLDSAGGRVFKSFTRGGGMGLEGMTGSPNLVVVPDPTTFRVLPWRRVWAGSFATSISATARLSISRLARFSSAPSPVSAKTISR